MNESTKTTIFKMSTELSMIKMYDNNNNNNNDSKSFQRIIKPNHQELATSKSYLDSFQKYQHELDTAKSVFGPYCLKPKKQQNSPLIYSTCQSIINTSSASVPSFYLNPIIRDNKNNKAMIKDSATAKITVVPPLPPPPPTPSSAFISENTVESGCSLLRRTSFADLQKQKQISSCKELSSPTLNTSNDVATYTTISRMITDDKSLSPKIFPPSSTSPLDPSFKNMISGCAFNYCDSAVSVLNKSTNKLKKSNSIASNQYFSQYMDKISAIRNEKKLKDTKLSHSSMDLADVNSPTILIVKKDEFKAPKVPPPPLPHKMTKISMPENKKDDIEKREVYSFNNEGKLTKSCSTSIINNDKNTDGVTYINVQQLTSNSVLVNREIPEFRLDVEKQKFENELKQKGLLNDSIKKNEFEDFKKDETNQCDSNKLKELTKIFDANLKETNKENNQNLIDNDEKEDQDEAKDKLKEINSNIETNSKEINKEEDNYTRLSKLTKKTESFCYKSIKNSPKKKHPPHTLAPLIVKSKQFFQQETHIPPHPGQTVNLKRNTSLPAKTLIRKNMSQFYDIRSKIQQFEQINTASSFNINSSIAINGSTDNINTDQNVSIQQISPNKLKKQNDISNLSTINEKTNLKVPDDFQSSVKVKQLKSIFEPVNGNNSLIKD